MRATMVRYSEYFNVGLQAFGETMRRILDALIGRPSLVPVPIPVRTDQRR